jgi:transposase InsO family protein
MVNGTTACAPARSLSQHELFKLLLLESLALYGRPEIFNSDQGSQFTSTAFTGVLEAAGVRISMDGKGRCMDNVFVERLWRSLKYEDIVCCERFVSA